MGNTTQFNMQQMGIASMGQNGPQSLNAQHLSVNHPITNIVPGNFLANFQYKLSFSL